MVSAFISRVIILLFGNLYPAYASYKAVKSKNVREYVKWMMYWIVFAIFTFIESFADIFIAVWFPFYYELKIIFILWLLAPQTKGSSFLYRKFIHPQLSQREQHIDDYLSRARDQGYHTVVSLGSRGLSLASQAFVHTAVQGQVKLLTHLRRSYSMDDIDRAGRTNQSHHSMDDMDRAGRTNQSEAARRDLSQSQARRDLDPAFSEDDDDGGGGRDMARKEYHGAIDNRALEARQDLMFNPIWEVQDDGGGGGGSSDDDGGIGDGDGGDGDGGVRRRAVMVGKSEVERYKERKEKQQQQRRAKTRSTTSSKKERSRKKKPIHYIDDDEDYEYGQAVV